MREIPIIFRSFTLYLSHYRASAFIMAENKDGIIKEGKAQIHTGTQIFYNPVQEFNRDMSVAALTVFAEEFKNTVSEKPTKRYHNNQQKLENPSSEDGTQDGITLVEALAATGLRSIRYALEVPNIKMIYANDRSIRAVESMIANIKENGTENLITAVNHDAVWLMQKLSYENKIIHAIDLDPYGCPTRFFDSTVNCLANGGLLMITCTDMAVIAGNTPETCFVKYGAVSLRSSACHEMALRIALQNISSHCARYGKYIIPLLSLSADFYIRIFVRVFSSQKICKQTSSNVSMVYQCVGCEMMTLHPFGKMTEKSDGNMSYSLPSGPPVSERCVHCGSKHRIGGPIWSGKLHDTDFVSKMLEIAKKNELGTSKRMLGMLSLIQEELSDIPLFYTVDSLCAKLHCIVIPLIDFRSALLNAGYRVSPSHCKTNSVKTNAPQTFIWDILRHWVKKNPISEKRKQEGGVAVTIIEKEPEFDVNFTFCKEAVSLTAASGLLRYQQNPLPFWGPGTRAKSNILIDGHAQKKERNQNKKNRQKKNPISNEAKVDEENGPE